MPSPRNVPSFLVNVTRIRCCCRVPAQDKISRTPDREDILTRPPYRRTLADCDEQDLAAAALLLRRAALRPGVSHHRDPRPHHYDEACADPGHEDDVKSLALVLEMAGLPGEFFKYCAGCNKYLLPLAFYPDRAARDGLWHKCRECKADLQRSYRARRRERKRLAQAA